MKNDKKEDVLLKDNPQKEIKNTAFPQSNLHKININKKTLLLSFGLLLVVLISIVSLLFFYSSKMKDKPFVDQNKRLKSFTPAINPEDTKLIEARKKILEYAKKNNITVSDDEISTRKKQLVSESGGDAIKTTLKNYGWSENDWTEVVRWQIMRSKIIEKIKPVRYGEVLSVRWDVYSSVLNEQVASEKKVVVIEYLEQVKQKLLSRTIKDLYTVFNSFDINTEPKFKGMEKKYGIQYDGFNEKTNQYKAFILSKDNVNYSFIMSTVPPTITDVKCTLGGCSIYNITSGTNGDELGNEILKLFTDTGIIF